MANVSQDLAVRGESVQRLYDLYVSDRFQVNRRYQRKLVWSVQEKQKLIDSILRDLPLPLFLVAEIAADKAGEFELIDGLQRMNAIFAFLENEFPVNGEYFDLDALADTKLAKDEKRLVQKLPVMDRMLSSSLSNYTVALSVFRARDEANVEEVFRRINSGGRRLSRQSLRQAGTLSPLADLVRVLSSRVRGDTSPTESVPLRRMPQLSITNYDLEYGVNVDDIFWVKNGVLRREDVRESLDEQLILDILLDCLIHPMVSTGTRIRDDYYNYGDADQAATPASLAVANAIDQSGSSVVAESFMRTYDAIRLVVNKSEKKFANLVGAGVGRSPRYYQAVFIAFYELMYGERMRLSNVTAAVSALSGSSSGALQVPGGGGDWTALVKRQTIDAVKGILRSSFEGPITEGADDLALFGYASQLETMLGNALVEQQLFDCKQGFFSLAPDRAFDETNLKKIARTLSAMANSGKGATGYVAVGVADTAADSARVEELDGVDPINYRGFHIVGIEREVALHGEPLNDYWHWLVQKLSTVGLDQAIAARVTSQSRLVEYHGLAVGLLKVTSGNEPNFFDGVMYERMGSETKVVNTSDYGRVYQSFLSS
jgi:hypothetical protein